MRFTLRSKTFAVKSAELSAAIPDPYWSRTYNPKGDPRLFWSLDVEAERETEGEMWRPRVYHENLQFRIRRWLEMAGRVVEWSERYDEESGEPNGGFYVVEHGDIPHARLSFFERDGTRFRFEWTGACDVFWDEEYNQDVPFSVSGWAEFTGVIVRGSESDTGETLRGRLASTSTQAISPKGRYAWTAIATRAASRWPMRDSVLWLGSRPNHTMQRMRASRLAQSQFGRPWRLARTANGER